MYCSILKVHESICILVIIYKKNAIISSFTYNRQNKNVHSFTQSQMLLHHSLKTCVLLIKNTQFCASTKKKHWTCSFCAIKAANQIFVPCLRLLLVINFKSLQARNTELHKFMKIDCELYPVTKVYLACCVVFATCWWLQNLIYYMTDVIPKYMGKVVIYSLHIGIFKSLDVNTSE